MNRQDLKRPVGWVFIVLSVVVVFGTLREKYGGGPVFHQWVPFFGTAFAVLFFAVQTGLYFWFRTKIGSAWITGIFVVGLIAGSIGESIWSDKTNTAVNPVVERVLKEYGLPTSDFDWTRHKLIAGVCLSGIVLGFGLVGEKL